MSIDWQLGLGCCVVILIFAAMSRILVRNPAVNSNEPIASPEAERSSKKKEAEKEPRSSGLLMGLAVWAFLLFMIVGGVYWLATNHTDEDFHRRVAEAVAQRERAGFPSPDSTSTVSVDTTWYPIPAKIGQCVDINRLDQVAYRERLEDGSTVVIPAHIEAGVTQTERIDGHGRVVDVYTADSERHFSIPVRLKAIQTLNGKAVFKIRIKEKNIPSST